MTTAERTIVPAPPITISDIPDSKGWEDFGEVVAGIMSARPFVRPWDDQGQRIPRFIVLSRLMGPLDSADAFLRRPLSMQLMDYGISNETGEILRWNDPEGRRSPWANGPWNNPPGVGRAIVAMYPDDQGRVQAAPINRDGISVGIAGQYDDPVSEDAYAGLVALIAHHASKAGVPHTTPYSDDLIHPDTGVSFVLWHSTFCGDLKPDPGHVVKALTAVLVQAVRARMMDGGAA